MQSSPSNDPNIARPGALIHASVRALRSLRRPRRFRSVQACSFFYSAVCLGPTMLGAWRSSSIALAADAVSMGIDTIFALAVLLALRALQRQNALFFPYGTGRFETMVSGVIGFSMLLSALILFTLSATRFLSPVQPGQIGLGAVMVTVNLAKCIVLWFWAKMADDGDSVIATQWRRQMMFYLILNVVILVAVVLSALLGGVFSLLDAAAALVIAGVMLVQAIRCLSSSVFELSDRALEETVQLSILRGLADSFDDFDDLIDVRSRRLGGQPHIDVVLGFDAERRWSDILARCAEARSNIERNVKGARVKVLPSSVDLWKRSEGRGQEPAEAAAE